MNRLIDSISLHQWRHSDARPITFHVCIRIIGYGHPVYVRSVRNGEYTITMDPLYAYCFSRSTAAKHAATLLERGVI